MDVLKVKTSLVPVHLKLFKAGIMKQDHKKCYVCSRDPKGCFDVHKDIQMLISNCVLQVSGNKKNDEVSVIVPIFNKPKAFEIFCSPKKSTPPADSAKHLDIKMSDPFPYKSDKVVPWEYEPTTVVNDVEKSLVNNKVITNIADASNLTRRGRVFTPANLRGGKHVVEKPDNGKAPLVVPESRPIQDVEDEEFVHLIQKSDYKSLIIWTERSMSKQLPDNRLPVLNYTFKLDGARFEEFEDQKKGNYGLNNSRLIIWH
ncbi:hypothetical protein KIW84_065811 [Lathyrus oleraceus]|uniref:Uncharacterized protein n=1 Tax=Pisum sativum TaxID=3888 RepID=A0A9D5AAA5_PEA|nr:hypothetical protein KIW84_065811 [Pisum sativum]